MFYFCHNCTENPQLLGEEIITLEKITDVTGEWTRMVTSRHSVFFNDLVPCVAGRKVWTQRERANKLISEAKKVVSVLDEAFTVLALKNYWKRWKNTGTAIWTDSKVGNYQYMGRADAAYVEFDGLCNKIREQRKSASNMKKIRAGVLGKITHAVGRRRNHARRVMGGQLETNVEVYNELDSDDED
jgi:hypothetical protein